MGTSGVNILLKRKTNNTADLKMGRATRKRDVPCVVRALKLEFLHRNCAVRVTTKYEVVTSVTAYESCVIHRMFRCQTTWTTQMNPSTPNR